MNSRHKNNSYDVIDLTESFTMANTRFCSNTVIELDTTDEFNISINSDIDYDEQQYLKKSCRSTSVKTKQNKSSCLNKEPPEPRETTTRKSFVDLGECPICCEKLGKNPLASTICGHVYCLKCLEQSLKIAKKCPTCRRIIKKSSGYHPLYLNI